MIDYINKNLSYPKEAIRKGIEGRVVVFFVVSTTGELSDIRILKSADVSLNDEALRLVKDMPAWIPTENEERKLQCKILLPINFTLQK
jgi:protein TonB